VIGWVDLQPAGECCTQVAAIAIREMYGWLRREDGLNARSLSQVKKLLAGTRH
jgi:hypothetical protein